MNNPPHPAKTTPILPAVSVAGLPGLKRQLYRTNLSHSLESPVSKGEHHNMPAQSVLARHPATVNQFFPISNPSPLTPNFPPAFVLLPMVQSRLLSYRNYPFPLYAPLCRLIFHTFQPILQTYASAVPPLFVSFTQLCHTFSHFVERFQTPNPHFSPKNPN